MKTYKMTPEKKKLWDDVLFWSRRCSYNQARNRPEWHEKYQKAKEALNAYKNIAP